MALFHVTYTYTEDAAGRDEHRPAHRAFLGDLHAKDVVLMVGPFVDDLAPGAALIVRADDADQALSVLDGDPFNVNGLIQARTARAWVQVFGPFAV